MEALLFHEITMDAIHQRHKPEAVLTVVVVSTHQAQSSEVLEVLVIWAVPLDDCRGCPYLTSLVLQQLGRVVLQALPEWVGRLLGRLCPVQDLSGIGQAVLEIKGSNP